MPPPAAAKSRKNAPTPPSRPSPGTSIKQVSDIQKGADGDSAAISRLHSLPGFGPRLIERAMNELGSAEAVLQAFESGQVQRLGRIPGISSRLLRQLVNHETGNDPDAFLPTKRARRLYEGFQSKLLARACTLNGRDRLRLLVPHPEREERARRLDWCEQAAAEAGGIDLEAARKPLRRLHALQAPKPSYEADVLLLFDTPEDLQAARDQGLHRWAPLAHVRTPDLIDQVQQANQVIHATRDAAARPHRLEQADHLLSVPHTLEAERLAPWGTLQRHMDSRTTLQAAAEISRMRGRESPSRLALQLLDARPQSRKPQTTGDLATRAQVLLEEELQRSEEELSRLTLTGSELMRALAEDLPAPVTRIYLQAAERANKRLEEETGLSLQAYTDTTPPRVEEQAIHAAATKAAATGARERLQREHELAKKLHGLDEAIQAEIADHEAFDARQAIGSFWNDHALSRPEWGDGFLLEGLRPLQLEGPVESVDYRLGIGPDGARDETTVALLTGANSGGKTTLLESITLLVALAHAGLGVPAERAVLPELDAVHLYTPASDRSAGALETLLLELFPLIDKGGRRLVLADELEAITELEAACEILAALLEGMIEQGTHAVLATHLAPHLVPALDDATRHRVRIDGIEAHGLDEDGGLLVHRSPRLNHLARSTPELILRRLAAHGPRGLAGRFEALAERVHDRLAGKREEGAGR